MHISLSVKKEKKRKEKWLFTSYATGIWISQKIVKGRINCLAQEYKGRGRREPPYSSYGVNVASVIEAVYLATNMPLRPWGIQPGEQSRLELHQRTPPVTFFVELYTTEQKSWNWWCGRRHDP